MSEPPTHLLLRRLIPSLWEWGVRVLVGCELCACSGRFIHTYMVTHNARILSTSQYTDVCFTIRRASSASESVRASRERVRLPADPGTC